MLQKVLIIRAIPLLIGKMKMGKTLLMMEMWRYGCSPSCTRGKLNNVVRQPSCPIAKDTYKSINL